MEKKFYWLYITVFINIVGIGMIFPILPLFARTFNATSLQVGLLVASLAFVQFLTAPFLGKLSDKYGRKPLIMFSILANTISFLVTGLAPNLGVVFIGMALQGLGTAGVLPAALAYVADVTNGHDRSKFISRVTGTFALGFMIGPAFGGILGSSQLSLPFFAAFFVGIVNLIVVKSLLQETLTHPDKDLSLRGGLISLNSLFSGIKGQFGIFFYLLFAWAFFIGHLSLTLPFYVQDTFGFKAFETGILFSITGSTAAVTQWVILPIIERRFGDLRTIFIGAMALTSFLVLAAFAINSIAFVVVMMFAVWGSATMRPSINAYLSKKTLTGQGAIMGLAFSFESLGRVLGPLALGFLYLNVDHKAPFIAVSLVLILGILLYITVERARQHKD